MRMRVADIVPARLLQLKEAVVVAHDPIIADRALVFQTKNLPQLDRARRLAVIVFRCRRFGRVKPSIGPLGIGHYLLDLDWSATFLVGCGMTAS